VVPIGWSSRAEISAQAKCRKRGEDIGAVLVVVDSTRPHERYGGRAAPVGTLVVEDRAGPGSYRQRQCRGACVHLRWGCKRAAAPGRDMSDHDDADPGQEQEWLRESDLINGGLILIGVYLVQPFLTAASLDLSARICVVAFSVAIPLLAALVLVNRRELSRHRATRSRLVVWTRVVAQNLAFAGVVAGFWHIWWIAGVGCWQAESWRWASTRPATSA